MARWSQTIQVNNLKDANGNPTGGTVEGKGLHIEWQDGPLGRGLDKQESNGAFVEDVLQAALERLQFYNDSPYRCRENSLAITHIEEALMWLDKRHDDRESRQVQGLHAV